MKNLYMYMLVDTKVWFPHMHISTLANVHIITYNHAFPYKSCTFMYMHFHTCISIHVHLCTCISIHAFPYMYIYVHAFPYMHFHTCTFMYMHFHTCISIHVHLCTCISIHVHLCPYMHILCTCISCTFTYNNYAFPYMHKCMSRRALYLNRVLSSGGGGGEASPQKFSASPQNILQ